MNDDRFQLVVQTFEQAIGMPPGTRDEFVRRQVGHDPALHDEVRGLLAHHDAKGAFVATGAGLAAVGESGGVRPSVAEMPSPPVLSGNYRILRTIGEGGMGIVFEAEQSFPRRRVALKAVRPGMASLGLLRRFRNEVEMLGRLQHPGIAQLYEAGIADQASPDQAFFAMELVDGVNLTEYAARARLNTHARWEILLKVCLAVQHAHQRGVIHRDLKPGNILVGADGQPKVVDFGIARAAEESAQESVATRTGQLIGTPSYMSPEQMSGQPADTRSDVYALGVVAYELLVGRLPFNLSGKPLTEAARIVREDEPQALSRFDRSLRGDAEIIIGKALAKDPDRRYPSAGELGEDIRRYLAGDAIAARRDSAMYLIRKQVRRHRTMARLVLLGIVSLIAFAIYASINAERQHQLAVSATQARDQERAAKEEALAARAEALSELAQSNIERGRLEAASDNLPLAEDMLWREYFADPKSTSAWWGLWELYDRIPSTWIVQGPGVIGMPVVSGDNRTIAWSTNYGSVIFLDALTGRTIADRAIPDDSIGSIAMSFDGSSLVAISPAGRAYLFLATGHAPPVPLVAMTGLRGAAFSPSGEMLATVGSDKVVRLWDLSTSRVLRSFTVAGTPRLLAFSPDGSLLAVGGDAAAPALATSVWNVATASLEADLSEHQSVGLTTLAFFPSSNRLTLAQRGGVVCFWQPGEPAPALDSESLSNNFISLSPAPDGRFVLAGSLDRPWLVDSLRLIPPKMQVRHRYSVAACAWNAPDDVTLVTNDGLIRRMSLQANPSASRITGFGGWCFAVTYSPDGSRLAVGCTGSTDVIDTASRSRVARFTAPSPTFRTRQVRFIDRGSRLLATGMDGVLRGLNPETCDVLFSMPGERSELYSLDVSPDGSIAAIGHSNRITRIFDLRTREPVVTLPTLEKRIEGLAFSPDGSVLAVSGYNNGVAIFDAHTWQLIRRVETTSAPWAIAFTPDGARMIITTQGGSIEVFSIPQWKNLRVLYAHQRLIPALAISPDGRLFATGGEDALVKLWDTATLRNLASFDTAGMAVVTLAFSPDSSRLVASVANRSIIEYNLAASGDRIRAHEEFHRQRLAPASPINPARPPQAAPARP